MPLFEMQPESYNFYWPKIFRDESFKIKELCNNLILNIEHVGSTSVAGLKAKPIIDVIIEVKKGQLSDLIKPLTKLKYTSKGENGISGRLYFSRVSSEENPPFHIHAFEDGHFEVAKHLAFRDYLRAHQDVKKSYNDLKEKILSIPLVTRTQYQELKNDFVAENTQKAIEWYLPRAPIKRVKKVVIYVIREINKELEVLVFDHVKYPEVNPQVPSGTVEKNEDIIYAAKRELFEESGLSLQQDFQFLGFYEYYKNHNNQLHERNHFLIFVNNLSEAWNHAVTGVGVDKSLEFRYYWLPVAKARVCLQVGLGDGLGFLADKNFKYN